METFLELNKKLQDCYKEEYKDDLTTRQKQLLCMESRIELAKYLSSNNLNTISLAKERIEILQERKNNKLSERRKFMDSIS